MARVFKTGVTVEGDVAANSGNITSSAATARIVSPSSGAAPTTVFVGHSGTAPSTSTTLNIGGVANSTTIPTGVTMNANFHAVYTVSSGAFVNSTLNSIYSLSGSSTTSIAGGFANSSTSTVNINVWSNSSGTQATVIGSTVGTNTLTIRGTSTQSGTATFSAGITFSGANSPITLGASNGLSGQVLTSSGAGTTPTWSTVLSASNPLLTSISTVGGGGSEGGQVNFARVTDGAQYWSIDSYGSTTTPSLRFIADTSARLEITSAGVLNVNGQSGSVGQVLTSQGSGTAPTWTTPSSGATGFDPFMLMGA